MLKLIEPLSNMCLDQGNENFEPSTVMITSIDVGNPSYNIIPSKVSVKFNIRFNQKKECFNNFSINGRFVALFILLCISLWW